MTLYTLLCPVKHKARFKIALERAEPMFDFVKLLVSLYDLGSTQIYSVGRYAYVAVVFFAFGYFRFVQFITVL